MTNRELLSIVDRAIGSCAMGAALEAYLRNQVELEDAKMATVLEARLIALETGKKAIPVMVDETVTKA